MRPHSLNATKKKNQIDNFSKFCTIAILLFILFFFCNLLFPIWFVYSLLIRLILNDRQVEICPLINRSRSNVYLNQIQVHDITNRIVYVYSNYLMLIPLDQILSVHPNVYRSKNNYHLLHKQL